MADRISLDNALRALGAATSGDGLGDVPAAEVPAYLPVALHALATGLHAPEPVPADERGAAWLLQDVAALVPGAIVIDEDDRDGLAVESLGRALLIDRGDERWSVVPWPPPAPTTVEERVLGTFSPSEEQIRAWAADPNLHFAAQDEDLAILHPYWLELIIELAADPTGPRRDLLRSIARRIVELPGAGAVALMTQARERARATGDRELVAWADEIDRILAYGRGRGPVQAEEAREIARLVMIAGRPALVLDERADGPWWTFEGRFPDAGPAVDRLIVHAPTGNLGWAPRSDAPVDYAEIEQAPTRLAVVDPALR